MILIKFKRKYIFNAFVVSKRHRVPKLSRRCLPESLKNRLLFYSVGVTFMKQRTNTKLALFLLAIFVMAGRK